MTEQIIDTSRWEKLGEWAYCADPFTVRDIIIAELDELPLHSFPGFFDAYKIGYERMKEDSNVA